LYTNQLLLNYVITYFIFYNLNIILFLSLIITIDSKIKTTNKLKKLNDSNFLKNSTIILIFSIAGIPPFIFFFFKLSLMYFISYINFNLIFILYVLIFVGLFFYISNIRFLMYINEDKINSFSYFLINYNINVVYLTVFTLFTNLFGVFIMDDAIILVSSLFF